MPEDGVQDIQDHYEMLGGALGVLGPPSGIAAPTPDGIGSSQDFERGSIHWLPTTGAHEVHGAIVGKWSELGREGGILGYPLTDELAAPDAVGRFNHFERGSVYWTPLTGAHEVHGAIRTRWTELNWERGELGYPTTDETDLPDGTYTVRVIVDGQHMIKESNEDNNVATVKIQLTRSKVTVLEETATGL